MIHSCGDVDELFDDLISIGLNCFNPFQPEVMDVDSILKAYRGRLAFHGGLSMQKTLPFGTKGGGDPGVGTSVGTRQRRKLYFFTFPFGRGRYFAGEYSGFYRGGSKTIKIKH